MGSLRCKVHWIEGVSPGRLGTMAHPYGAEFLPAQMEALRREGVQTVVSLLEPYDAEVLQLQDERPCCEGAGLRFLAFPIQDHGVPEDMAEARAFALKLKQEIDSGRSVAVHCFAGIGRATLMAACTLILLGLTADEALDRISAARGMRVPDTGEQEEWVRRFAETMTP
ncbi:MAG: dual specificity protein phosphatase family protein [Planctomycetes bacterium]|nr:dual specificity protein phosphatase family protein [Planctomycetota bacterium]